MSSRSKNYLTTIITACLALAGVNRSAAEPTPSEIDALRTKLASELTFARRVAVEKLGRMGPDASIATTELISALQSDSDDMVRTRSAWALGEIKQNDRKTVTALLEATCDPNPGVRANALGALRSIGSPAVPQLEEALVAKNARIRIAAVRILFVLGQKPNEASLAALRSAFDDPSPEIRELAANCAALAGANASPLIPRLIVLLDDPAAGVREVTATTLAKVDLHGVSEAGLIRVLARDSGKKVRKAAAMTLGAIGAPTEKRIPALLDAFHDSDEDVRVNASQAIARFLGAAAVPQLLETLTSTRARIRELAVDSLLELGPKAQPAVDPLLSLLRSDPESRVRFRVASALGAIGDASPEVLEALKTSAAIDKDSTVCAHSTGALKTLVSGEASPSE